MTLDIQSLSTWTLFVLRLRQSDTASCSRFLIFVDVKTDLQAERYSLWCMAQLEMVNKSTTIVQLKSKYANYYQRCTFHVFK